MLTEICQYLRNWFEVEKIYGAFVIEDNGITSNGVPLDLLPGQFIRIVGSILNDGVHQYPASDLEDETFTGAVWSMAIPPAVLFLAREIEDWSTENKTAISSPYASESFGGYSCSLRAGTDSSGQQIAPTWQSQFAGRLSMWRKI